MELYFDKLLVSIITREHSEHKPPTYWTHRDGVAGLAFSCGERRRCFKSLCLLKQPAIQLSLLNTGDALNVRLYHCATFLPNEIP